MLLSEPPSWYRLTLLAPCPVPLGLLQVLSLLWNVFAKYTLLTIDWTHVLQEITTSEFLCFFIRPMTREILVQGVLIDVPCILSCIVEHNYPSRKRILRVQHCTNCNENFMGSNEWQNLLSPDFQSWVFFFFWGVEGKWVWVFLFCLGFFWGFFVCLGFFFKHIFRIQHRGTA